MSDDTVYMGLMNDLRDAYRNARRRKGGTGSCIRCSMDIEQELDCLARTIIDGTYQMRPSICFPVDKPVMREVIAADFRDRIVHHYIYDYLNPWLERELIDDCYSCRVGKGTSYGVDRLEHHILSCSRNYTRECWALQLDISGYFMSIDRHRLLQMAMALMERIGRRRDKQGRRLGDLGRHRFVGQLLKKVVLCNPLQGCELRDPKGIYDLIPRNKSLRFAPEGVGLPIGNLTSQMFSNLYMNGFDQWVKRELKVKHYGRYVDDSFYLSTDREWLVSLVPRIAQRLQSDYGIRLNFRKTKLTEVRRGITFLGTHLKPFRRYLRRDTIRRLRQLSAEMSTVSRAMLTSDGVRALLLSQANSMLGLLGRTRSFRLRRRLFGNHPMFRIAYGMPWMRKFRSTGDRQHRGFPSEARLPVAFQTLVLSVPRAA